MTIVKPELAGGFRDYLPEDMIPRQKMLETIKQTFECFGFVPLDTPAMERTEVLGNEGSDFLIYGVNSGGRAKDPSGGMTLQSNVDELSMRYDLTVPLARVVAANTDKLVLPFKRYQFGRVWRGEKQQTAKGRYREFSQLDVDIVGSGSVMADAEVVALMYETLAALGLAENFVIGLNNRKIFDVLPAYLGLPEQRLGEILRLMDKKDKIGITGVMAELNKLGLAEVNSKKAQDFLSLTGASEDILQKAQEICARSVKSSDGFQELQQLIANITDLGVPKNNWNIDLSLVRGLGYYTGNVFEAVVKPLSNIGSVFSGGRYDGLVARFAPLAIPAVGASVGIDRLFSALDELGLLKKEKTTAKVLVLNFDADCHDTVQRVATELRRAEVSSEIYLGQEDTLKGQLAYAVKREFPFVLIIGQKEKERDVVQLKNMNAHTQEEFKSDQVVRQIQTLLE